MSKLEVLVATMNRGNLDFLDSMNISTDAVVVNQDSDKNNVKQHVVNGNQVKLINSTDKGLSKSRNLAIENASADICAIADDDMLYDDDYSEKIIEAHEKYPEADVIAFQVTRVGNPSSNPEREKKFREKANWDKYLTSMKITSVEMTFKREKIVDNDITFNPNFGVGAKFNNGEENIFLYEVLRKGLKILYLPITIAEVDASESTWYEGFTKRFFYTMGAKFYNMSPKFHHLLMYQYAVRKLKYFKEDTSLKEAITYMYEGKRMYQDEYEK